MAEKTHWIADASGNKAEVTDVDTWRPHGWTEAAEPEPGEFVWLQHEEHGGRQLFAQEVVETWSALGWKPAAPPEPVDLTRDRNLTDVQPEKATSTTNKPVKAASGGSSKES